MKVWGVELVSGWWINRKLTEWVMGLQMSMWDEGEDWFWLGGNEVDSDCQLVVQVVGELRDDQGRQNFALLPVL